MPYTIQSSEKTRSTSSEFETKALLYLMNFRTDSDEIHFFAIDFFNDVTGLDKHSKKAWDLQSKGSKNNYPADIGKELVTLFKNFISELSFDHYILFVGGVVDSIRIDNTINVFGIGNIPENSLGKISDALKKESESKSYIDNSSINSENIKNFLSKVVFVVDDKEKSEYVKSIIRVSQRIVPPNDILEEIFDQIRDVQSSKKNNGRVEGITISEKEDFIYHCRHLTSHEIKMMVLNRIINNDFMQKGITYSFVPIYGKFLNSAYKKNILEDCKLNIAKTLFDKNNAENFWKLFADIYTAVTLPDYLSIDEAYKKLDTNTLSSLIFLDIISVKYLMALIKDGIHDN